MIKTKNVTKIYTDHEVETVALDRVNIEIHKGEFIGFLGPSGSGKTSLVNILGLLSRPTRGEYYFMDTEVSQLNPKQLTAARRGQIGFISKHFELIDELTVKENVELPLLYLKTPASERGNRVKEALERMNIAHKRNHYPQQLSDVQQQRAAAWRWPELHEAHPTVGGDAEAGMPAVVRDVDPRAVCRADDRVSRLEGDLPSVDLDRCHGLYSLSGRTRRRSC